MPLAKVLHPSPGEERKHKQHLGRAPVPTSWTWNAQVAVEWAPPSAMHQPQFGVLAAPLPSVNPREEKQGFQKDAPSEGKALDSK